VWCISLVCTLCNVLLLCTFELSAVVYCVLLCLLYFCEEQHPCRSSRSLNHLFFAVIYRKHIKFCGLNFRGLSKILICECIKFRGYKFLWAAIKSGITPSGRMVSSVRSKILWWNKLDSFTKLSRGHFMSNFSALKKIDSYSQIKVGSHANKLVIFKHSYLQMKVGSHTNKLMIFKHIRSIRVRCHVWVVLCVC